MSSHWASPALDLTHVDGFRTLAAIFQATFVTPDLVTIAAEKVFSHRLELKSSRRRKILGGSHTQSSISSSPVPTPQRRPSHGKAPMHGYQSSRQRREVPARGKGRRSSTSSEQSSEGGASFVEVTDSEDDTSVDVPRECQDQGCEGSADCDETTAADVVRDVLLAVYPPI